MFTAAGESSKVTTTDLVGSLFRSRCSQKTPFVYTLYHGGGTSERGALVELSMLYLQNALVQTNVLNYYARNNPGVCLFRIRQLFFHYLQYYTGRCRAN